MTANEPEQKEVTPVYQPTPQELAVIVNHVAGRKNNEISPNMKVLDDGRTFMPNHPDKIAGQLLLMEAMGTTNYDFYDGLVVQLANAARHERVNELEFNFLLSVVKGIKPRDQLEAMLAAQTATTHNLAMKYVRQLNECTTIQQRDSLERTLNKLQRTFVTQVEALKRHRAGVEPKVVVQQVSVSDGGQAIVSNITQAARENASTSPPALTDAGVAPMAVIENPEHSPLALPSAQNDDE